MPGAGEGKGEVLTNGYKVADVPGGWVLETCRTTSCVQMIIHTVHLKVCEDSRSRGKCSYPQKIKFKNKSAAQAESTKVKITSVSGGPQNIKHPKLKYRTIEKGEEKCAL